MPRVMQAPMLCTAVEIMVVAHALAFGHVNAAMYAGKHYLRFGRSTGASGRRVLARTRCGLGKGTPPPIDGEHYKDE